MAQHGRITASVLVVGNEILSGRTRDANIQFLGAALTELGIRLVEARVVEDDEAAIIAAINSLRQDRTYLFTTGGIGPTHDDITAAAVARALGRPLVRNAEAARRLHAYYGDQINEARLSMADMPADAWLIDNPISQAPGFRVDNVFVMAGVPRIMQAMFDAIRPLLQGGPVLSCRTVTLYAGEGRIAAPLSAIQGRFPQVEIGSYPFFKSDTVGVSVVVRCDDKARLDEAAAAVSDMAASLNIAWEEQP